jgi:hypothetical protein
MLNAREVLYPIDAKWRQEARCHSPVGEQTAHPSWQSLRVSAGGNCGVRPHTTSSAAFRASAWSVGLAGGHGGGRICPRGGVDAQCIGRPVPVGRVPGRVCRVGCGYPGGGDEQRAYRGSRGRRAGRRDAGLGVSLGLLARALTGIPAIWPAVGGVSVGAMAVACAAGRLRRERGDHRGPGHRGSPRASGVMRMPASRQPDDGAGKYPGNTFV